MPPELLRPAVAALGALALAVGLVALVNGRVGGIVLALGGVVLVAWSMAGHRLRP